MKSLAFVEFLARDLSPRDQGKDVRVGAFFLRLELRDLGLLLAGGDDFETRLVGQLGDCRGSLHHVFLLLDDVRQDPYDLLLVHPLGEAQDEWLCLHDPVFEQHGVDEDGSLDLSRSFWLVEGVQEPG